MNAITAAPDIEALIFDMDGTLVDSEPLTGIALDALLRQHACVIDLEDPELNERWTGRRMSEILAALAEMCGITVPARELNDALEALRLEVLRGRLQAYPGAHELIAFGREAGLPLVLATSGRRSYVDAVLAETGLTGSFAIEVTGEDVTHGKPDPETYLLAASRLGVAPARCIVFEDAPAGVAAAVAAGMRAAAVPNVYTRTMRFSPPPEAVLPALSAAIPWLQAQGVGAELVTSAAAVL